MQLIGFATKIGSIFGHTIT